MVARAVVGIPTLLCLWISEIIADYWSVACLGISSTLGLLAAAFVLRRFARDDTSGGDGREGLHSPLEVWSVLKFAAFLGAVNGQIVIRPINYLAMSYDHRIIDGREAVLGLVAMKEALEDPARLLFDI